MNNAKFPEKYLFQINEKVGKYLIVFKDSSSSEKSISTMLNS